MIRLWRGNLEAWGLWLARPSAPSLKETWVQDCRALRAEPGVLLVFPQPRRLQCELALGFPVLALAGGWSVGPGLLPSRGQVVWVWEGQILRRPLADMIAMDLSELWQDQPLQYQEGGLLAAPTLSRPSLKATLPEQVHQVLAQVPPPAAERDQWLQKLRNDPAQVPTSRNNPLLGLFELFRSFFHSPENQRYVKKMLDLFDQQRWEEALRYAIPIDSSLPAERMRQFLGTLRPRSTLQFSSPLMGGWVVGTGLQGLDLLRAIYRKALEKLLEAGRIEEAAFVQGELLGDALGAVELLASHQLWTQAARLAAIKGLPASLQIRLWFEAGQTETALQLARLTFAHAEALAHLMRRNPELGRSFKRAWACDLARVERWGEALRLGWEEREFLPQWPQWFAQSLAQDDLEPVLLGFFDPQLRSQHRLLERAQDWMQEADPLLGDRRQRFLDQLAGQEAPDPLEPAVQEWSLRTVRRALRQAGGPFPWASSRALNFLTRICGDPWLKADRPILPPAPRLRLGVWREVVQEKGYTPLYEACPAGHGQILVGLGQAGMLVLNAAGKVQQRHGEPVQRIVAPQSGGPFLLECEGHLHRFDARSGTVTPWCRVQLTDFAPHHTGFHWLVVDRQRLYLIDLSDPGWKALKRVDLPHPVVFLALRGTQLGLMLNLRGAGEKVELHFYSFPALDFQRQFAESIPHSWPVVGPETHFRLSIRDKDWLFGQFPIPRPKGPWTAEWQCNQLLLHSRHEEGVDLVVFDPTHPQQQFHLLLTGARRACFRVMGRHLYVCDDMGRLLVADLQECRWLRQHFL